MSKTPSAVLTVALPVVSILLLVPGRALADVHNCSTVVGGLPETSPPHHLMRESVSTGHIDPGWFPNASGNDLGPRPLGTDEVRTGCRRRLSHREQRAPAGLHAVRLEQAGKWWA